MKVTFLTLFPEMIQAYMQASIMGRAVAQGALQVEIVNPRDFAHPPHYKVDDAPYGGGSGMVLQCEPFHQAFLSIAPLAQSSRLLMPSPTGGMFSHAVAQSYQSAEQLIFFCGHYEGFDARLQQVIPDIEEVSLGDFVLTGGELPALCITDAVARLLPGTVQKFSSVEQDSFYQGRLDYPHYTRPSVYEGLSVPEVLLSGNHEAIQQWRAREAFYRTAQHRPDLFEQVPLSPQEQEWAKTL